MPKFLFFLHLSDLPLNREGSDETEVGGLYVWRGGEAPSEEEALDLAIGGLLEDPLLLEELREEDTSGIEIEVEEVRVLDDEADLEEAESGLVFYLEDDG